MKTRFIVLSLVLVLFMSAFVPAPVRAGCPLSELNAFMDTNDLPFYLYTSGTPNGYILAGTTTAQSLGWVSGTPTWFAVTFYDEGTEVIMKVYVKTLDWCG